MEIIYCATGNRRFAEIAVSAGMRYGAQLPGTIYPDVAPLHFADQDWKRPDRARYVAAIAQHRPRIATVLDWEREEQLSEVLDWSEEVAPYVEQIVIIPKVTGGIDRIPTQIGGREIVLGYSVPTKFGGTDVPLWEFSGWPVHLLGGSPQRQMHVAHYCRVNSADGNYTARMAQTTNQYWMPGTARFAKNRYWPRLDEANDGRLWGDGSNSADAPYEAFRRSCANVMEAWRELQAATP